MSDALRKLVTVKPLEWEDFEGLGAKASGFYQANYLIQKWSGESRYEVAMSYPGYQTGYDGPRWHPTLDAAKAAAQADYTARVRAALIPRPAEPAQTAQVDVMVNLYVQLENLLAVYSEPDKQLCCDGHMCGCQGATEYQQAEHYAKAALDEARAALQHKDDTHGPE